MTKFQTSQALSILMSLALVVATWVPTIALPGTTPAIQIAAIA